MWNPLQLTFDRLERRADVARDREVDLADHARDLRDGGRALRVLGAPRSFDRLTDLLHVEL